MHSADTTNAHLMLISQVCLQVIQLSAVEVAKPTLVRFDFIVLHHVHMQVFSTTTGESAFVAAKHNAFKVT